VDHGGPLRSGFGWKLSQRQTGTTMAPAHPQPGAETDHLRSASQQITLGQQMPVFVHSGVDVTRTAPGSSGFRRC